MQSQWRKSSFCARDEPMCVEVREINDQIIIKDQYNARSRFSRKEFAAFVKGVKAGEFDDLT